MSCIRALEHSLAQRQPIRLAEVVAEAALQRRVDRKFLLSKEELALFLGSLGTDFKAMDIAGRRVFRYSSTYFDTPELAQYHAHRQGRRRRFKVRTRSYLDTGLCMFEAKLKGPRGETDKHRIRHPLEDRNHLNANAARFLAQVLEERYGLPLPELGPVLTTDYRRGTLVSPASRERVTCDVGLLCKNGDRSVAGPELVVVETKSTGGRGAADQVLASMGLRELGMSKYCVGIALLNPQLPANKWHRLLKDRFGWSREAPAAGA